MIILLNNKSGHFVNCRCHNGPFIVLERSVHQVYGTELNNIMERFIEQHIKDRTEYVLMTTFHAENLTMTIGVLNRETNRLSHHKS
jgi:hypothetical protein